MLFHEVLEINNEFSDKNIRIIYIVWCNFDYSIENVDCKILLSAQWGSTFAWRRCGVNGLINWAVAEACNPYGRLTRTRGYD